MKKLIIIVFFAFGIIFIHSCKKKHQSTPAPTIPLQFTSLTVNPTPVYPGTTSTITATATGSNLVYTWTISHGDLFGSGAVVEDFTQPCCVGFNTVTCTVSDGTNSISKNAILEVYPGH